MQHSVNPHLTIEPASQNCLDLRTAIVAQDPGAFTDGMVTCHVRSGVVIGGVNASSGTKSFAVGAFAEGAYVHLVNDGVIDGKGGAGATGALAGSCATPTTAGTAAGTALHTGVSLKVTNNGSIREGGGGGGGGASGQFAEKTCDNNAAGDNGGDGAGNGVAAQAAGGGPGANGGAGGTWAADGSGGSSSSGNCGCGGGTGGSGGGNTGFYIDGASLTTFLVNGTRTGGSTG